jgi:hypothetical protein
VKRAALLAVLFSACTPLQWVHDSASADQFGRDQEECRQAAWREASSRYWFHRSMGPIIAPGQVLWNHGAMIDPYGYQMLEENRLAQFCMEAKGYRLEEAPRR